MLWSYSVRLYNLERDIKDLNAEEHLSIRQQSEKPIWMEFGRWLQQDIPELNEISDIYKAFAYTMSRFKKLAVYMEDLTKVAFIPVKNLQNF
ncbi:MULTISPECIES: IS66 family transposase [Sphingobacterium]|uniref:IS66 family transposase n=1 Tax=Sphingobacterium TaxID=28453 RepID=UPI00257E8DC6|nr:MULTISPECIES: transposase [Sphingobacterium]